MGDRSPTPLGRPSIDLGRCVVETKTPFEERWLNFPDLPSHPCLVLELAVAHDVPSCMSLRRCRFGADCDFAHEVRSPGNRHPFRQLEVWLDALAESTDRAEGASMSSMNRVIDADVLVHHLTQDEWMLDADLLQRHGRTARTIVKEGPLRLTVMGLSAGGLLPAHTTEAQVTIHLLEGEVVFKARGREYALTTGDVLILGPGVEHEARSEKGGMFLLTVVFLGHNDQPSPSP
jgi:quercetin dioxygenase-like cupin family protein